MYPDWQGTIFCLACMIGATGAAALAYIFWLCWEIESKKKRKTIPGEAQ